MTTLKPTGQAPDIKRNTNPSLPGLGKFLNVLIAGNAL